jgi:SNF2 family DNA or RNA helicase
MKNRKDLHAYQHKAVDFIIDKRRCALYLDMGLGKTVTTLTAITDLIDSFAVSSVLVIAPLRVANSVWKQECRQWEHLHDLSVSVCTGTERQRRAALMKSADVYVINRENVPWLVDLYKTKWPFDAVVIDESSSFKNPSAKRFKKLKKILPYTEYMTLLTGTPSPNGLLDLWAQTYLIDFGVKLGRTMTGYKQRFFESDFMGYTWTPKEGASKEIHSLLSDFTLSMSAEDYLELPDRVDLVEYVDLPPQTKKAYEKFETELLATLEDGEEIEASTAAVLANRLLQYSNGAIYTDEHKNWSEIHTQKLDALSEIIEENPEENLLVAYNYKHDLERILKRYPDAVILDKNSDTVDRWNNGDIKLLLAHPASAGHGLNLQHGGSVIVWFGLNWSLELDQQFNKRIARQGQTKPVRIVRIVAKDCIDERVLQVLEQKGATQKELLNALKK